MTAQVRAEALQWQILQSPSSAKTWLELANATDAIDYDKEGEAARVNAVSIVFERALRALPLSFKLWLHYIRYRTERTAPLCSPHEWFQSIRELYVRALAQLPRMPLLWTSYLRFVMDFTVQVRITMVRHILLDALAALPATQHHLLWRLAKPWLRRRGVPHETMRALWSLYLRFDTAVPAQREYLHVLLERKDFAGFLAHCVHICQVSNRADRDGGGTAVGQGNKKERTHEGNGSEDGEGDGVVSGRVAQQLTEDLAFWELVIVALRTPGWTYTSLTSNNDGKNETNSDRAVGGGVGCEDGLRVLAELGRRRSASATDFDLAYALFLCGQGDVVAGRALLRRLLENAIGADRFAALYAIAVEVEERVVEACALHAALRAASDATRAAIYAALFGAPNTSDPLRPLRHLVARHALMLNQAQLREGPRNAWLWLKRIELAEEQRLLGETASRATPAVKDEEKKEEEKNEEDAISMEDVVALYRQAIAQCTTGLHTVDNAVGQLYESLAMTLVRLRRVQEGLDVLQEGVWQVPFCSRAINVHLLGRYVELRVMTSTADTKDDEEETEGRESGFACVRAMVATELLTRLSTSSSSSSSSATTTSSARHASPASSARRGHSLFLVSQNASLVASATQREVWAAVGGDARAWLLAWDVCGGPSITPSRAVRQAKKAWLLQYWSSPACTCEALCAVAWQLWRAEANDTTTTTANNNNKESTSRVLRAQWLMERLFLRARSAAPLTALFALSQYVSFLLCERARTANRSSSGSNAFSLYRLREVMGVLREVAPHSLPAAPAATLELTMCLVALESKFGQRGIALREMQSMTLLALELLPCAEDEGTHRNSRDTSSHERILAGLLEKTMEMTAECLGSEAVRPWCAALLRRLRQPRLIQRVALHWAALERRSGRLAQAHAVFEACAESQNPATQSGGVYWHLWESLCDSVQSFARVAQRRQQVEVLFAKRRLARKRARERNEGEAAAEPKAKARTAITTTTTTITGVAKEKEGDDQPRAVQAVQ